MRFFAFLTLLIIVESVNSHSSTFLSHARRSKDIIKRQGGLLGLGGTFFFFGCTRYMSIHCCLGPPSPPSPSQSNSGGGGAGGGGGGGLIGGILGGKPPPTTAAPATSASSGGDGGAVGGLLSPLAPVVQPLTSAAAPVLKPVVSAAAPVVNPVASAAAPVVTPIVSAAAPVVKPVVSAAAPVASAVGSAAAPVVKPIASAAAPVASVVASAAAPVASAVGSVAAPVASVVASAAAPVGSAVGSVAAPVASVVASVATPVASAVGSVAAPVASVVASVATPVASAVGSVAAPVLSAVTSVAAPVTSLVGSVAAPVLSAVTSVAAPITSLAGSVAAPVLSAVTSVAAPVTSLAGSVAAPVLSVVTSVAAPVTSLAGSVAAPIITVVTSVAAPVTSLAGSVAAPIITTAVAPVTSIFPPPNSGTPTLIPTPETPTIIVSTIVPDIPSISSAPPLVSVISFPQPSIAAVPTITANSPLVKATTMSIDSKISFILTISSLALNSIPTTPAISLTNPDQASSTALPANAVPTTSLPLPSGMPARIYPPDRLDPNTDLTGYTFIAILFDLELNWPFVVLNSISSTQIFAYMPIILTTALGIDGETSFSFILLLLISIFVAIGTQILTWALQVFIPTSYQTPADADQLGTLWLGYVPSNLVTTLSQEILAKQSKFYMGESDPVVRALAEHVNSGFSILSVSDPNTGGPSSGDGGQTRRDAIIGVVSSLGGIAFFVLVFLAYRMMKNRRDHAHRRLSEGPDAAGVRPEGQDFDQDSVGGARRRSFYYAEDSLRGFQDPEPEQIAGPSVMTERRTIAPGTLISAPVLQENSLNW